MISVIVNLYQNFSFGIGYLAMRCSKLCYLCNFDLVDLFDNEVIEQVEYIIFAGVVELVDTRDLKSLDWKRSYEFKSRLRQVLTYSALLFIYYPVS